MTRLSLLKEEVINPSETLHVTTRRRQWQQSSVVLLLAHLLHMQACEAFLRIPPRIRTLQLLSSPISSSFGSTGKAVIEDLTDDVKHSNDQKDSWIGWLLTGKPRGTSKVYMREAVELGGVARSERYSSKDWFHNTITLPSSGILKDIRSPVFCLTSWGVFLSIVHRKLLQTNPAAAARLYIPSAPHSLMMSALGLLLVFRTNSAYQRFAEGRQIWEVIVNTSRDLFRMLMLYENEIGMDKRRRMQSLLAAFPYLLRHRIRPNLVMKRLDDEQFERDPTNTILLYQDTGPKDMDYEAAAVAQTEETTGKSRRKTRPLYWVDKRSLPWRLLPPEALEKCARAQNRPLWVCDRMAKEICMVPDQPNFLNRERLLIIDHINKLSRCIGGSERIHQTVVPLNYARHTLRALTLWLFTLPFAVVKDLQGGTGPIIFLVSWLLFGVYEIGVRIEDPFQGTLRLSIMCDMVRRDVLADESIRSTAFQLETEGEKVDGADLEDDEEEEA
ncbi:hypothetical protein MPSEU_000929900 [Mayamaea pseudoterrestris]|nr:hypothetical protein MPSEU_000929900 [Mayamaea pseudoterrestris]